MGPDKEEKSTATTKKRVLTINTEKKKKKGEEKHDEDGEALSPAARLFHQRSFNCHIIAMMGLAKRIDVDAVKAGLEETLLRHPRFSSVMVPGTKERWLRTKVVIDNHIVVPDLNVEDSSLSSRDQLVEDYVSSLSTTTLPLSQPLWDIHILNIRTSEAEAIAVLRVHHSLGDGVSLISLLLACTRRTSDPNALPTLPDSQRRSAHSGGRGLCGFIMSIWKVMVLMWHTLVDVLLFVATSTFLKDTETPLKGKGGVGFHRKRFIHRYLSLDDVKVVKNAVGCTVNDVLVGITSAALSRYLNRRYGEMDDAKDKKKNLPPNIRLRTTMLVNVRKNSGIHALAELMKGHGGARWGNRIGYAILRFPIAMFEDPVDYIRKGMEVTERKKNSLESIFTYASGVLIVKLLGIKVAAALCHRMLSNTTVSFSSIAGPVEEIGFYDHPLVYIAPSVYGHPQAVTLHFQSYMNKIKLVLAVDELTVPDPKRLVDDFVESLKLIKDATVKNSS
ncbi:O-acyltransferase WSD1-like [Iris pallida]|uniref:O-acyltransferase WSD1-like n=1 Tax=Iris pallida TaxID=29817 RepID=A0AAX6GJM7_IRIPA|nr:O-acyltransferase WSD1-like [Iris pallida]